MGKQFNALAALAFAILAASTLGAFTQPPPSDFEMRSIWCDPDRQLRSPEVNTASALTTSHDHARGSSVSWSPQNVIVCKPPLYER